MRDLESRLLDDDFEDEGGALATWMFNFVLGMLGVTVIGLAFFELDIEEPRYLYNPWTYAIIVPFALVMLSAISSVLVSRIIKRSMQAAFLLSVLAHLLILTGFSNIIIHSRYWPQLFDSLAQQRQQLKKESLQARQYVKVSLSTQPNLRPDYLKHVPTEHQPTEVPREQDRNLQLAKADVQHLITPKVQPEKSDSAHLLKRNQSQSTRPTYSPDAAKLSRSELSQPSPQNTSTPSYEIYQSEPQLQAALPDSQESRATHSPKSALAAPTNMQPEPSRDLAPARSDLQRKLDNQTTPTFEAPAAKLSRSNSDPSQPRTSTTPIPSTTPAIEPNQALAAASIASNTRRASESAASLSAPKQLDSASREFAPSSGSGLRRSEQQVRLPNPSDGATPLAINRSSAGGAAGPAARSSLPRLGDNVAFASAEPTELGAASDSTRRSDSGRTSSSLGTIQDAGSPAGALWDGATRLSGGIAARTPTQLAGSGSGDANSSDPAAAMSGAGRDLQRASVGVIGPTGSLALPSGANGLDTTDPSKLQIGASSMSNGTRSAGSVSKSTNNLELTDGMATGHSFSSQASTSKLPAGLQPKRDEEGQGSAVTADQANVQRSNDLAGTTPKSGRVNGPELPLGQEPSIELQTNSAGSQRSRSDLKSGRMQVPLDIQAPVGAGGFANTPNIDSIALLPRRSGDRTEISLPQFDAQPIMRSEVGGPLAAGKSVAKPAFQQRLDRLQNRDPSQALDPQTELAIEMGLEFLAKYQREDGSWRLQDFDTEVLIRSDTAATGLALLAFQGAGYTHIDSKYAMQVHRAINFLAKNQRANGDLYIPQNPASDQNGWLYSHAIAALALSEAYGMTQDESLRPTAQRAVDFMVGSQDPKRGGWRYRPESGSDTSVTGWYMMALQSAKLAGLKVPETTFENIRSYAQHAQVSTDEPHLYRYNPFAPDTDEYRYGLRPTAVMTSVGLLIRLYMGWQRNDKQMMDGSSYLLIHSPQNGTKEKSRRDTYYWYYATQVIFHMGGDYWKRWHDTLNPMLIRDQVREGRYAGSWDPMLPVPDLWANYGGRLYVTTMNLLSLEVSYRHLPLYEATAK